MAMRPLVSDTSPESERVQIESFGALPPWRKWRVLEDLILTTRELALAGLRERFPSAGPQELRRPAKGEVRESVEQRQLGARLRQHDRSGAVSFAGSVGDVNCTSHPKGCTSRMRLGSTILTSDSPAKNVVMRMLLNGVLTTT